MGENRRAHAGGGSFPAGDKDRCDTRPSEAMVVNESFNSIDRRTDGYLGCDALTRARTSWTKAQDKAMLLISRRLAAGPK